MLDVLEDFKKIWKVDVTVYLDDYLNTKDYNPIYRSHLEMRLPYLTEDEKKAVHQRMQNYQGPFTERHLYFKYLMCAYGIGVAIDLKAGLAHLEELSAAGNSLADAQIGFYYETGQGGVPQDYKKAMDYYNKAIDAGCVKALRRKANLLDKGLGIEKNQKEAIRLWKQAGTYGDVTAFYDLAVALPSYDQATIAYVELAAAGGVLNAVYFLGCCYQHGNGVGQNRFSAQECYTVAAEYGQMGLAYNALGTLEWDTTKSFTYFKRAALYGSYNAFDSLADQDDITGLRKRCFKKLYEEKFEATQAQLPRLKLLLDADTKEDGVVAYHTALLLNDKFLFRDTVRSRLEGFRKLVQAEDADHLQQHVWLYEECMNNMDASKFAPFFNARLAFVSLSLGNMDAARYRVSLLPANLVLARAEAIAIAQLLLMDGSNSNAKALSYLLPHVQDASVQRMIWSALKPETLFNEAEFSAVLNQYFIDMTAQELKSELAGFMNNSYLSKDQKHVIQKKNYDLWLTSDKLLFPEKLVILYALCYKKDDVKAIVIKNHITPVIEKTYAMSIENVLKDEVDNCFVSIDKFAKVPQKAKGSIDYLKNLLPENEEDVAKLKSQLRVS